MKRFISFVWLKRCPHPLRRPLRAIAWIARIGIGVVTLLLLLTIIATLPIANLFVLGYLLEAESQVARSGEWGRALPLLPAAIRIGSIVAGVLLFLLPVMLLADLAADARLIASGAVVTRCWIAGLIVVSVLVSVHVMLACWRGGSLGCFLCPLENIRCLRANLRTSEGGPRPGRDFYDLLTALRPWQHFWLGVRGFFGTWVWLALPSALYGVGWDSGSTWYRLATLVAGACFIPLLAWIPFLQVRLAVENRWSAMFEVHSIRELFRHAPLSWLVATAAFYALSIPLFLYSFHFRMRVPFDLRIWWDLSFMSIVCTLPARAALGWAYHRATRSGLAWVGWIWLSRMLLAGALALYVWLLFHTPLTHEAQPWQLEHHSLVLPIPW